MGMEPASFKNLPGPLRMGVALASAGGLLAAVWVVTNALPPRIRGATVLGITLGIMAVGLLLVFYVQVVKWRKARRAKPMEQQVLRSAGAGRQGISDPEQLARIDDLRKKFEEGIATFRSAGKSLYSLPWHVILGEPGSGKTEAIRHCGIGFPPGLHDRYQGVGGTINMNWWFTDYGVIIDTAGRLMFEEASSGGTREWKEFLSLLGKFRPSCPINGALLVIPCDSLIRDNADEIEKKASQIAQQFDAIQRTLDVRFPVYVVVTKSDLINGFREFFDSVSDPQLQHQILGWSNPQELDKPYDPHFVDKYLEEMKTRLFRMRLTRMGELLGEDAEDREKPTPDALYAFPYAFEQLGPRLKRYLDLIFSVGSQWSCKPLFFRGIYFTSSMQEGAALDEDLAAALGVPVESLPTGPVWRRDRAYFLRDLFTNKVFREWGLVTQATNARKLYARRRAVVMACAAASLLVLIFLTVYGGLGFWRSVGTLEGVLGLAAEEPDSLSLIRSRAGYSYRGDEELRDGVLLHAYFADLAEQADNWRQSKGIPRVFRPAVRWKIDEDLQEAARKVYVTGVLQPLVLAVAERMSAQNDAARTWEKDESDILYYLIALRAGRSLDRPSGTACLDSLMRYVQPRNAEAYEEHKTGLANPLAMLYSSKYPPSRAFDGASIARIDKAIIAGVQSFNAYWTNLGGEDSELKAIAKLVCYLTGADLARGSKDPNNFADIEQQFIGKYTAVDPNADLWEKQLDADYRKLAEARLRIDQARGALANSPSLQQAWVLPAKRHLELLNASYSRLLAAFPEVVADSNQADPNMVKCRQDLKAGLEACTRRLSDQDLKGQLAGIDSEFWANGLYDLRFSMYQTGMDCLGELREMRITDVDSLPSMLQSGRQRMREGQEKTQSTLKQYGQRHRVKEAHQAAVALLRYGDLRLCRDVVLWWLGKMPADVSSLEAYIRRDANDPYSPKATSRVFLAWGCVNKDCQIPKMPKDIQSRLQPMPQEYGKYARAYIDYCLKERGLALLRSNLPKAEDWRTCHARLSAMSRVPTDVFKMLDACNKELRGYLAPVESYCQGYDLVTEFNSRWASLDNKYDQKKCEAVLAKWSSLGEDYHAARSTVLRCKPEEFVQTYFVSDSAPRIASPDFYWYELGVTALDLLAREVDRDARQELDAMKGCDGKFPLSKWGSENLTATDVERIRRFSERLLIGSYPAETIGAGATTGNGELNGLLERLRAVAKPPAWIRNIDMLPPVRGKYSCQIYEVKTTPEFRARRVVITKGPESATGTGGATAAQTVTWDDRARNTKPVGVLAYDCSNDSVQMALYTLPSGGELMEKPAVFSGPWAWHRMLENREFEKDSSTYVLRHEVSVKGEDKPVKIEIRLRFFKEPDCSGSPFEVFSSAP